MFISVLDSKLLIGFNKVLIVADYYTYNVLELYDSVPTSEKVTPAKNTQYCICD